MELRQLKTFRVVARTLSFTRAARELRLVQSSVSAQIQALETSLDIKLFERMGRTIRLTSAGERLLDYATRAEDLSEEIRSELTGAAEARGGLVMRVPESACAWGFPKVVRQFSAKYPRVRLDIRPCLGRNLAEDLRKGVTDLAFLYADSIRGSDMEVTLLRTEPLILVAGPSHPLAERRNIGPADMDGQTLLYSSADCSYRKILEDLLDDEGVSPAAVHEFSCSEAIRQTVAEGTGISIFPRHAVREMLSGGWLSPLAWNGPELETGLLMVRSKGKWLSPLLKRFMNIAKDVLGS